MNDMEITQQDRDEIDRHIREGHGDGYRAAIARALALVPESVNHGGDIVVAIMELVGEVLNARTWRAALDAEADSVLVLLDSALGERPASVVEGVRALLDAVAEAKPFPVRCGADHMSDSARQAQADLAEARRKGAEQERARIAGKILRHCGRARESALAYPTGDPRIAISDIYCTGLEKLAREIESGEWSGEVVTDG